MQRRATVFAVASCCGAFFVPSARAQVLTQWQSRTLTFGGAPRQTLDVAVAPDDTVYASVTDELVIPFGGTLPRALVVRFDATGTITWAREASLHSLSANAKIGVGNGFVYAAGAQPGNGVLRKYTSCGTLAWEVTQPVAFPQVIGNSRPFVLADEGALVSTFSWDFGAQAESVLRRYTATGGLLWTKMLTSGSVNNGLGPVAIASNGDILVSGIVGGNVVVSRLDSAGASLWSDSFTVGTQPYAFSTGAFLRQVDVSISGGARFDYALAAHDALGNRLWTREVPRGVSFAVTSDDRIVVASADGVGPSGVDVFLTRVDAAGNVAAPVRWVRPGDQAVLSVVAGEAGEVIVVGREGTNAFVATFDAQLQPVWSTTTTPPPGITDTANYSSRSSSGRLAIGGQCSGAGNLGLVAAFDASAAPDGYCSAKVNSLGCEPALVFSGLSSASAASGFTLSATRVLNQVNGLYVYGVNGASSTPFQGGSMCVAPPRQRAPVSSSGGLPGPSTNCSGVLSIDVNAFASGALGGTPLPQLTTPGVRVNWQCWSRDANSSFGTNLSNALSYVVLP
ncbi:MAG: PQQ-like beta-propeller repeat protein [Planctomycetes bacterium]|nr:PQQ-like beta-propeller repeat protein [Planctomycetota bacterium]